MNISVSEIARSYVCDRGDWWGYKVIQDTTVVIECSHSSIDIIILYVYDYLFNSKDSIFEKQIKQAVPLFAIFISDLYNLLSF